MSYFEKEKITEYELSYPCKTSSLVTELRKKGDTIGQYVQNVYYLDTLSYSYDGTEIYSSIDEYEDSPVYSAYHAECDYCKEHKQRIKENLVVGFKIYPKGVKPKYTYKERTEQWKQFR